jgi:hypothetical protein
MNWHNNVWRFSFNVTKMLLDMKDFTYEERLWKLKLPSLRYRRYDRNFKDSNWNLWQACDKSTFHQTRGHSLKLTKNRSRLDIRKYYFTNRVVEDWNNLPESVITAKNLKKNWKQTRQAVAKPPYDVRPYL